MTIFDLIRDRASQTIPLNALLGVEIRSVAAGEAEAHLPFRTEMTNHVGSFHATAIFGVAEAASGCALAGALAPVITAIRPVVAGAEVKFLAPARRALTARARLVDGSDADALVAEISSTGRIVVRLAVEVSDEGGNRVAELAFDWHITLRR
jgi:uncharacterized protein (TIGR00369 family)